MLSGQCIELMFSQQLFNCKMWRQYYDRGFIRKVMMEMINHMMKIQCCVECEQNQCIMHEDKFYILDIELKKFCKQIRIKMIKTLSSNYKFKEYFTLRC
ncbi:unnamed protein product [Paramecium primaurelia]|uniref:Uncharacterized protein n=1 Tax=Paramecium primaurelia TaxID=5886 RepID=A0A8S1LZL8_PARPR|nr:unnamed protein product [Paramecium primaurelia]